MSENVLNISNYRKKGFSGYNISNSRVTGSGNDGGDGMSGELERRVRHLENDVSEIKNNLITLTTRSESLSSKADVLEIREGLRLEMAENRTEIQKSFASQTWQLTGIILSAMAVLVAVVVAIK
ncbi:hypothetical protein LH739_000775 [Salmonella enterica]|nr:hypothetical protein [Salmonella enterica]EME9660475.1 hypothetical protein [Salmonella enterica]